LLASQVRSGPRTRSSGTRPSLTLRGTHSARGDYWPGLWTVARAHQYSLPVALDGPQRAS
jgi:hypothetical protein